MHDREILPLVECMLDPVNPREWYWALMDYGSFLGRTMPNPNKRSRHYTKQGGFEGSDRQIRGRIIRTLVCEGPVEKERLIGMLGGDDQKVRSLIDRLEKEGFLSDDGGRSHSENDGVVKNPSCNLTTPLMPTQRDDTPVADAPPYVCAPIQRQGPCS